MIFISSWDSDPGDVDPDTDPALEEQLIPDQTVKKNGGSWSYLITFTSHYKTY